MNFDKNIEEKCKIIFDWLYDYSSDYDETFRLAQNVRLVQKLLNELNDVDKGKYNENI